ncbi:MAG: hypothetical protein KL787_04140 [Taibaiella sp.]|nr:hypothetical protein [Taibaiella sp.]
MSKHIPVNVKSVFPGSQVFLSRTIREYSVTNTLKEAEQECSNRSRSYAEDGVTTREECELY